MLEHGIQLGPADWEEVEHDPQHQPYVVQPERPQAEALAERGALACGVSQTEVDEADGQKPEGTKQRRVRMIQCEERAVLVVIHERGIQCSSAEHAGTYEIPECRSDDVHVCEAVLELLLPAD